MAESEQKVLTKEELEIIEIAERLQEVILDEFGEYPFNILLSAFMYNVSLMSKGNILFTQKLPAHPQYDEPDFDIEQGE